MTAYAHRPAMASSAAQRPLRDNVIILYEHIRDARKERTLASGLIVPHVAREPQVGEACWAVVVACGPGRFADKWIDQEKGTAFVGSRRFIPLELSVGDRVLICGPLCGDAITIEGVEHRVTISDQIVGVEESMKIKPLYDRVIVRRIEEQNKTPGGIFIPDNAKEKPIEGEVVAVGAGKIQDNGERRKPDVAAGDRVLFGKYAGIEVKIENVEHLILREEDVLTVVE